MGRGHWESGVTAVLSPTVNHSWAPSWGLGLPEDGDTPKPSMGMVIWGCTFPQ